MKIKRRYMILMGLVGLIALIGAFFPETPGIWEPDDKFNAANVAWMITATIFVLMMTPGLSFFYGGMVGRKNVISTILQSFIAMGIISMLWVVVGFSLSFGSDVGGLGLIGNPAQFFMFRDVGAKVDTTIAPTIPLALFALFQMKFAIITPSLITGVFAQTGLIAWTHAGFMEFVAAVAGVAIVIIYTFVVSMVLYWATNRMIPMRVSPASESLGLDASQHDEVYGVALA